VYLLQSSSVEECYWNLFLNRMMSNILQWSEKKRKKERQKDRKTERQKDRKTERQKDKKTKRQKDKKTKRQKDKKTKRQKDKKTKRQIDKKTNRQKDRKTERQKDRKTEKKRVRFVLPVRRSIKYHAKEIGSSTQAETRVMDDPCVTKKNYKNKKVWKKWWTCVGLRLSSQCLRCWDALFVKKCSFCLCVDQLFYTKLICMSFNCLCYKSGLSVFLLVISFTQNLFVCLATVFVIKVDFLSFCWLSLLHKTYLYVFQLSLLKNVLSVFLLFNSLTQNLSVCLKTILSVFVKILPFKVVWSLICTYLLWLTTTVKLHEKCQE
jgi:hypothetical protein